MSFQILGTGSCVPDRIVTNDELSTFLDTSDEWIRTRTGIGERRVMEAESLTDLAYQAALAALDNAGIKAADVEFILCATVQGDMKFPAMSCLLQARLGASCPCFDINAACSGFVYALDVAHSFILAKGLKNVLVVCAEGLSRLADWRDRATCVLFGDAAGAAVIGPGEGWRQTLLGTQGNQTALYAHHERGNSPYAKGDDHKSTFLAMDGQEVFKFAVSSIDAGIREVCQKAGLAPDDIDWFLLHQANLRIINSARTRLKLPEEKFPTNIERFGNTSSATIPLLLDQMNREGRLKAGQKLLLGAFGAGLTTGFCLLEWTKPQ